MRALKLIGFTVITIILLFGLFILYASITYFDPPQKLLIAENKISDTLQCNSNLTIISWNIGYAGLGDNMDFFYDGGKKVRDTYERTVTNLDSIAKFLIRHSSTTNFILIQEVDLHSKRSYYINERDTLTKKINFNNSLAQNYVVNFVPIPPSSPMGKVNSGVLTLSKPQPTSAIRYAYPGRFSWPNRLFNLRRCMLVNRYHTSNGKELVLINSHLSAFDDGSLKKQEMDYLTSFVQNEYAKGNYVIAGGDWNQSPPKFPLNTFGENFKVDFFKLTNVNEQLLPKEWNWVYDPKSPTNRYLNNAYQQGKTFSSIIDFFLTSPNIEILTSCTFNLNFRNSDHNPIIMNFTLKQ